MKVADGLPLLCLVVMLFVSASYAYPALNIDRAKRTFSESDINYIRDGLYVGDQYAASDIQELRNKFNITAILNVAWDLDILYPTQEFVGNIEDANSHLQIQYAKVGLVDASGNSLSTLAAAVLTLHQFFQPRVLVEKDEDTYPKPVRNVLVHCHSGQSRSVTVASLYVYFRFRRDYPTYNDALQYVRSRRRLTVHPRAELTELADRLVQRELLTLLD